MTSMDGRAFDPGRILPELSNVELVGILRMNGCTGVLWLRTVDRIVSYATTILRRELMDGTINPTLARLRCPIRISSAEQEHLRMHPAERDDLVEDAVVAGLLRLSQHGILRGEWDPAKGADVMTYFVNSCLLALPNPLRDWRKHRAAILPSLLDDESDLDALAALSSADGDPASQVHDRAVLEDLLAELPTEIVEVARCVASDGLSWAAACRRYGMSPRVVEGYLRRFRRGRPEEE